MKKTNTHIGCLAQVLANLAENQRAMLEAIQQVSTRALTHSKNKSDVPAEKDAPKTEKTAPKITGPKATWPRVGKVAWRRSPDGYAPLFGVTSS